MKNFIFKLLYQFRIPHFFHAWNRERGKIPILLFHDIKPIRNNTTGSITPKEFEKFIVFLKNKYEISSLQSKEPPISSNACIITFDDGMYSFFKYAYPIIKKHNVSVTLFIPTTSVEEGSTWALKYLQQSASSKEQEINYLLEQKKYLEMKKVKVDDEYRLMQWSELKALDHNIVNIQSHADTHRFLSPLTLKHMRKEFQNSISILKDKLNVKATSIAYPFGAHSDKVIDQGANYFENGFVVGDCLTPANRIYENMKNYRFHIHNGNLEELYLRISGFIPWLKRNMF